MKKRTATNRSISILLVCLMLLGIASSAIITASAETINTEIIIRPATVMGEYIPEMFETHPMVYAPKSFEIISGALRDGDTITDVTYSGERVYAGTAESTITSFKIMRDGVDVTSSYTNVKTEPGTITVFAFMPPAPGFDLSVAPGKVLKLSDLRAGMGNLPFDSFSLSGVGSYDPAVGYTAPNTEGTACLVFTEPEIDVNSDGTPDIGMYEVTLDITITNETDINPFVDIWPGTYYYDAVKWAVAKGITTGTSAITFSPFDTCTRGQVATFLWRAMGSPEPKKTVNPFTDIKETDYYYKPILWAFENNITAGTSETTFSPNKTCLSAHVITFLWRAQGKPTVDVEVQGTEYYAEAAAWAEINGMIGAVDSFMDSGFMPDYPSPRTDIVTFLYMVADK